MSMLCSSIRPSINAHTVDAGVAHGHGVHDEEVEEKPPHDLLMSRSILDHRLQRDSSPRVQLLSLQLTVFEVLQGSSKTVESL